MMDQYFDLIDTLYGLLEINHERIVFTLVIILVIVYLKFGANLSTGQSLNVVALVATALLASSISFNTGKTSQSKCLNIK